MTLKQTEGAVFQPVPVLSPKADKTEMRTPMVSPHPTDPRCELCGHAVIATHCKRICLHCGFMTGCSEGI
jgi:hypothetical protein